MKKRYCIATVTDANFLVGAEILFYSFLKHNPWFDGDIVVIHDGLTAKDKARLDPFPNVHFHEVGNKLLHHVEGVCREIKHLNNKYARFYSLEVFALKGYDKVLFIDADMLCTGDASELMELQSSFSATPDGSYYRDMYRSADTYLKVKREDGEGVLERAFNSGMMVIDSSHFTGATLDGLMGEVDAEKWKRYQAQNADQIPLNYYFDGQVELLSSRFNFRFSIGDNILMKDGFSEDEVVFAHFTGKYKPWKFGMVMKMKYKKQHLRHKYTLLWRQYANEYRRNGLLT